MPVPRSARCEISRALMWSLGVLRGRSRRPCRRTRAATLGFRARHLLSLPPCLVHRARRCPIIRTHLVRPAASLWQSLRPKLGCRHQFPTLSRQTFGRPHNSTAASSLRQEPTYLSPGHPYAPITVLNFTSCVINGCACGFRSDRRSATRGRFLYDPSRVLSSSPPSRRAGPTFRAPDRLATRSPSARMSAAMLCTRRRPGHQCG